MKKSIFVFMAIALLAGSLACKIGSGTPQKPVETIPVTTEAAGSLQEKVQAAEEQAGAGGEVELVLTESEITSMVALELQKQPQQVVSDIQIYLRDGQVQIYGAYSDGGVSLPLVIVAKPEIPEDGSFQIVLISAKIGPVAAPDVLRESVQALLDEQIAGALSSQSGNQVVVSSVTIADGQITIRSRVP